MFFNNLSVSITLVIQLLWWSHHLNGIMFIQPKIFLPDVYFV